MAVILARQKMTVRHAEGEHTIYPSADPQSLPDALLDHAYVQGAIQSGWITVVPIENVQSGSEPEPTPEPTPTPSPRRRRSA